MFLNNTRCLLTGIVLTVAGCGGGGGDTQSIQDVEITGDVESTENTENTGDVESTEDAEGTGGTEADTDSDSNNNGVANLVRNTNPRVKTISFDFSQDGTINQTTTYFYDDSGRVTRIELEDLDNPQFEPDITEYEYSIDGIARVNERDVEIETLISYENGRVSTIADSDGDQRSYRYDSSGRLVGQTENENICDDFDFTVLEDGNTNVLYEYTDNRVTAINSTDDLNNTRDITASYNEQNQVRQLSIVENCDDDSSSNEVDQIFLTYDSMGLPVEIESISAIGNSLISDEVTTITRDEQGRVTQTVDRNVLSDTVIETRTLSYGENGLPATETVEFDNSSTFFTRTNTTITYTYEDASCVLSYSIDPARLALIDATINSNPSLTNSEALLCGYPFD